MALPQYDEPYVTVEEYLAFEQNAETKHEYASGEILAMSGASRNHNIITGNLLTVLNTQLRDSDCVVFPGDMRVHVANVNSFRYPDVAVVCGEEHYTEDNPPSLLNPTVIVEVLSPSTEIVDRVAKLAEYRAMPSVQAYLLVSQAKPQVEAYLRVSDSEWRLLDKTRLDVELTLTNPACVVSLADVYRKVMFPAK